MASTTKRVIVWIWVAILVTAWATPHAQQVLNQPRNPAQVFHSGRIRIGIDPSRPPFAFFNDNANYIGLEVELGRTLGEYIGLPVDFVGLGFDGLYDALTTKQVDIVIAGLQPNTSLANQRVLYSRPYFNNGLVLVSQTSRRIGDMEAVAGHSLAYAFGSEADAEAHRWLRRVAPFQLLPYELPEYALDAVKVGEANAAFVNALQAHQYLAKQTGWHAQVVPVTDQWFTIAIRVDRPDIWKVINDSLNALDETGTLDTILNNWLS